VISTTKKDRGFRMHPRQDVFTRIMLDYCNIGAFCKLASGIAEASLFPQRGSRAVSCKTKVNNDQH
jgi:hypothetical protein